MANTLGMNMTPQQLADLDAAMRQTIFRPFPFIPPTRPAQATGFYHFVGGIANGRSQEVEPDRRDYVVREYAPLRPMTIGLDCIMPQPIDSTLYTRRKWCVVDYYPFEYFAPADWTDDRVFDFITRGGYVGSHRQAVAQARSHSDPLAYRGAGRTTKAHAVAYCTDAEKDVTIEDAGIRAGEIVAWRAWELRFRRDRGPYLQSTYQPDGWQPGKPMTGDVGGPFGVHAFKHPMHAFAYLSELMTEYCDGDPSAPLGYVLGAVELYGTVIEHEIGYRAQNAKIAKLATAWPIRSYRAQRPSYDWQTAGLTETEGLGYMLADLQHQHRAK